MFVRAALVLALATVVLPTPSTAVAQAAAGESREGSGRVLTKIVVTMNEPGAYGRPAANLVFLVVAGDGDRSSIRTNEAGVASVWLTPGNYRLVTPDPLNWDGYAYTWDRMISVDSRSRVLQLSQNEARSIARSEFNSPVRTAEPAALSSQPTAWKAAAPPTQDLRSSTAAATKPVRTATVLPTNDEREEKPMIRKSTTASAPASAFATGPNVSGVNEPMISTTSAPKRSGAWFSIGTGYGAISCKHCSGSAGGYSGGLSLGATLSPRIRVGVGTTGWYRSESGAALVAGTLDARIRFYPSTTGGFFLTGGLGAGRIGAALAEYGTASEYGAGAVVGLGWDLRIASSMSLTPFWNGFAVQTANADAHVGQIGLGLTFH